MENEKPNYYAVIPADVRYSDISPNAKLLYGEISCLCNKEGYCWATNSYFANLYKVSNTSISLWIKELSDNNFIFFEIINGNKRKIFLKEVLRKLKGGIKKTYRSDIRKLKAYNSIIVNNNNKKNNKLNTISETSSQGKELTKIQKIVNHFFSLKGWDVKDNTKKAIYSRFVRPAKELLNLCDDDILEAQNCLDKIATWAKSRDLDFSIETVFKKWYELDQLKEKEKKPFIDGKRAFLNNGKWNIIFPNGEIKDCQFVNPKIEYK
jgi:hypothetical protein